MVWEYIRVPDDHKEGTMDSLEKICNEYAKDGWRIISISDGSQFRYATMEREKPNGDNQQANIGSGLQTFSVAIATGNEGSTGRTRRDKTSTKGQRDTGST